MLELDRLPSPPEVSNISKSNFEGEVADLYSPVVMRGFANDWPLVQEALKSDRDALAYLMRNAGTGTFNMVRLDKSHNSRMFYDADDLTKFNFQLQPTSIIDGLNLMAQGLENPEQPNACFQCIPLKKAFPALASQHTHPLINEKGVGYVWFGSKMKVAPHFDEAQNIAVAAVGRRRFTLFPPDQIENLYVGPVEKTPAGQPISLVDLHNPDLEKHPKYEIAYQHAMSVELNPGDAIYIPSPWWHHVESLSDFNFLVNYWWNDQRTSTESPFPALMHAFQAFNGMSEGEKKAWQAMLNHYVFSNDAERFNHIPENAQGVLGNNVKDKSVIIHNWLAQMLR